MRTRSRAAILAAAVALAGLSTSACGYFGMLKAQMAFKDANAAYQSQDYKKAIEKYKEALEHKPDLAIAYFYLGNSYDNLYKPARKGEPANDANLQEAVNYYRKATETITDNPKLRKLSYEYLLAAYGSEKLNDPSQAEPIVKKMIEMEPDEPTNYFALAKIYEDAGNYEEAEKMLTAAKDRRPKDADALHAAGRLLQPPGPVRQDDRGARGSARRPSRTTPRPTTRLPPTCGTRRSATSA